MSDITFTRAATHGAHLSLVQRAGLVLAGTLVLALSSQVSVPMVPVPVTLQTLAVVLVGAFYGWKLGGITVLAWLAEGALGLPVLASASGGPAAFVGPTAGYLLSFPLIGALAGWMVARGWDGGRPLWAFCAMLLAQTLCLVMGAAWLAVLIGPAKAWALGFAPFIPGDVIKSALAAATLALWHAAQARHAHHDA